MMLGLHTYHLIGLPLNCIILMDVVYLFINLKFEMLQLEAFLSQEYTSTSWRKKRHREYRVLVTLPSAAQI